MTDFEEAFRLTATAKHIHGYQRFYQQMLDGVGVESLLEIGVYLGQSLRAWRMVYPEALIEAVDWDMRFDKSIADEFNVFNFDSRLRAGVDIFIEREYDVIIDDGLHHWSAQMQTFANFEKFAKKFYVIEDVCGEYSYQKIMARLPDDVKARSTTFVGTGPPRTFRHKNNVERDAEYKIIFIDQRKKK